MLIKIIELFRRITRTNIFNQRFDEQKLLAGAVLTNQMLERAPFSSINEAEFKVFSQWGDDGIIQYLISELDIPNKTFIEFGVEDYSESNTRFLLMHNNWAGLVLDGSESNISKITKSYYYWKHDLDAVACFVDIDNINGYIADRGFDRDVGLLHIDIDGNDYWVWKAIDVINPILVIIEYNSVFGRERAITVPYRKDFDRTKAHYSNLYFGASLAALILLADEKGYAFVGSNSAGNNAYFVRNDKLTGTIRNRPIDAGYVYTKFRESRDRSGQLDYKRGQARLDKIKGLPIHNIETNEVEII
jgi:hypothetical protein